MKTSDLKLALRQCNKSLQNSAGENYFLLLEHICRANEGENERIILRLLSENPRDEELVRSLITFADALVSQKYDTALMHFRAHQLSNLIRKYPFPSEINPFDPDKEAFDTFMKSELKCKEINEMFSFYNNEGLPLAAVDESLLQRMRQYIKYVIGDSPDWNSIYQNCGFGPGASVGVTGNATHFGRKLSSVWSVSPGAYHYAFVAVMNHAQVREMLFPNPGGFTSSGADLDPETGPYSKKVKLIQYNKIAFVPKTARTSRSIAVEPILNGFLQKGVDRTMRARLARVGLDLSLQEPNSLMAREGSKEDVDDPYCTIDLSSASDSVSIGFVRAVLPAEWFSLMNAIRSKNYRIPGSKELVRYEKFCSMGNGFCFPLETLLFAAACHAVGSTDFRVYGDDIIVRKSCFVALVSLLESLGFATNMRKTFSSGPFRESCGGNWYGGEDVTPYTLDSALDSVQSIFKVLNGSRSTPKQECYFEGIREFLLTLIPRKFHFFRPYPGQEDTGIDTTGDEHLHSTHCTFKNGRWSWKEIVSEPIADRDFLRSDNGRGLPLLYAALIGSASDKPFTIRRKANTKVRVISHPGATSRWLPVPTSFGEGRASEDASGVI